MTTINLYQNPEETEKRKALTSNGGLFFSLGILLLTILTIFGLNFFIKIAVEKNADLAAQIEEQNQSLTKVNSLQRIVDLQTRITKIKNNLVIKGDSVSQQKMTDVLDRLGADLRSDVYVSVFSLENGKVKVSFVAENYESAAGQILNFKKSENFANAVLEGINRSEKNLSVEMAMDVKK